MANRKNSRLTMGRALITVGILLRIFQIIGSYLHMSAASGAILSGCMLCFFTGGLGVFAYEHRGRVTLFALICALCSLSSTFMVSVTELGGFVKFLSVVLYFLTFAAYGLMLMCMGRPLQKGAGVVIVLMGAALILPIAGIVVPEGAVLALLSGIWILMGVSIYI